MAQNTGYQRKPISGQFRFFFFVAVAKKSDKVPITRNLLAAKPHPWIKIHDFLSGTNGSGSKDK